MTLLTLSHSSARPIQIIRKLPLQLAIMGKMVSIGYLEAVIMKNPSVAELYTPLVTSHIV